MQAAWKQWRQLCASSVVLVLLLVAQQPAAGVLRLDGWTPPVPSFSGAHVAASTAPGISGSLHRLMTRAEHTTSRFALLFRRVGILWLSILLSAGVFLLVAAVFSVADLRMFDLRRQNAAMITRYLVDGMRTFFRILRDRHTPYVARAVLAVGMLYWLLPVDLVSDSSIVPGFIDDLIVTIVVAKAFMYLCPDWLVDAHAAAVEERAQAHA